MEMLEMEQRLKQYTLKEHQIKAGNRCEGEEYEKFRVEQEPSGQKRSIYIFEDEVFLEPQEPMGIYRQDRFEAVREHCHNYVELNYVWSGEFVQVINGKQELCKRGTLCVLDTATKHTVSEGKEEDIMINILMRKEFFEQILEKQISETGILMQFLKGVAEKEHMEAKYLRFDTEAYPQIRQILTLLIRETYSCCSGKEKMQRMYMTALFIELFRIYEQWGSGKETCDKSQQKIFRILKYIEDSSGETTIQDAAKFFGFSPKYLTMLLKEKTGRSFLSHVQEQRMNQAKKMLAHTDMSISQIIDLCGYKNEHFFYQKFKQATGITPGNYRKQSFK